VRSEQLIIIGTGAASKNIFYFSVTVTTVAFFVIVCTPHQHREVREFFKYETSLVIVLSLYMFQFTMLFIS